MQNGSEQFNVYASLMMAPFSGIALKHFYFSILKERFRLKLFV